MIFKARSNPNHSMILSPPTQIPLWLISAEVDITHQESQACCGEQSNS